MSLYLTGKTITKAYVDREIQKLQTGIVNDFMRSDPIREIKIITISDSVTTIGENAFNGCTSLISLTLGHSVSTIENKAFYNCYSLKSLNIPKSVTRIGDEAFYLCEELVSLSIPKSVEHIGIDAFKRNNIKAVIFEHYKPELMDSSIWNRGRSNSTLPTFIYPGVDLSGKVKDLKNANLSGANLSGANLSGIDFTNANLSFITWNGANLTNVKGLYNNNQINKTINLEILSAKHVPSEVIEYIQKSMIDNEKDAITKRKGRKTRKKKRRKAI